MDEPSLRTSRIAIAGGLLATIALAGGGFLLGRTTLPRPEPEESAPVPQPVATPSPAEVVGAIGRADILAIGARAADALASGLPSVTGAGAGVGDVAGRRFDIALPFGCEGSAGPDSAAPLRWRYDADKQTLRIHVAPIQWEKGDWGELALPDGTTPGLQGFWVNHPWASTESCPQVQAPVVAASASTPDDPAAPAGEQTPQVQEAVPVEAVERTLALAEIVPADPQARRSDRPYEIVKRMSPERFDPKRGFRLRLKGRIERLPSGQSVQCTQPLGIEHRPACVVAISLNEVRIENSLDGEVLATWTMHLEDRTVP